MNEYLQKIQRALLLFGQQRWDMAEDSLRSAIADEPDEGRAYSVLATVKCAQKDLKVAQELADRGVGLSPDDCFAHFALAQVYYHRDKRKLALEAIDVALTIDPTDADYHALKAAIYIDSQKWKQAIECAERGLQFAPEHVDCINYRAIGLRKLGNRDEASDAIQSALAKSPEDATSHANLGWLALENSDPRKAIEHFSEALRLEPNNEWARQGMLQSLKARNVFYRQVLKAHLWISRFEERTLMLMFIGMIIVLQVMSRLPDDGSPLQIIGILLSFAYMTFVSTIWLAGPIFNLLLRLDRHGRLILTSEERSDTNYLLAALVGWAVLCSLPMITGFRRFDLISYTLLLIPVAVLLSTPREAKRVQITAVTLAVWGIALYYAFRWYIDPGIDGLAGFNPFGGEAFEEQTLLDLKIDQLRAFVERQGNLETWFTWGSVLPTWFASYFQKIDR